VESGRRENQKVTQFSVFYILDEECPSTEELEDMMVVGA
jgi:hypothetical protein